MATTNAPLPQPAGGWPSCPVTRIGGIWRFERTPGYRSRCFSTPGHLLHLVERGRATLTVSGRTCRVGPGDVVAYCDCEEVRSQIGPGRYAFLSVAFDAPSLPPPPADRRVFPAPAEVREAFGALHHLSPAGRQADPARLYAALFRILQAVPYGADAGSDPADPERALWWDLEQQVRRERRFRARLGELATLAGRSRATLTRACRRATGRSVGGRLCELRMAEAQGLLQFSTLNVSQVAAELGYPRVHEFSREFRRQTGRTPTAFRRDASTGT
ncbi:MAG: helix-turn-helix domain-containing protein [Planctomycetota bacterium]